jgi:hypothetical protein
MNITTRTTQALARYAARLTIAVALIAAGGNALLAATPKPRVESYGYAPESGGAPDPRPVATSDALVYDRDYPFIHYADPPVHNDIAQLQQRLNDGSLQLTPTPLHGYLESMLKALNIDPDSQTLVFSKTSLQVDAISAQTPRAIYFNDNTYVAWVQKTGILEVVTMDADRGPVFYTLSTADSRPRLQREILRCLTCHDSFAEMGGGVPHFLFESTYDVQHGHLLPDADTRETSNETPIADRWGGWYVTGNDGGSRHLGNIQPPDTHSPVEFDKVRRSSLASLKSLFDTTPYLRDTSDIVALLVLEHQVTVHNQISHANYKSRTLLDRELPGRDVATLHFVQLSPKVQDRLALMLRPLVDALLMINAAPLPNKVAGSTGYAAWFQDQGPRDERGRSLRQLDLQSRVFRYPLSFLIYSQGFDALPLCAREQVYAMLAQLLQEPHPAAPYSNRSAADRRAAFDILMATKPDFARAESY